LAELFQVANDICVQDARRDVVAGVARGTCGGSAPINDLVPRTT
jgi:hypothetical protein